MTRKSQAIALMTLAAAMAPDRQQAIEYRPLHTPKALKPRRAYAAKPGILDEIRTADSAERVEQLLARLETYEHASQGTRSRALRLALRRLAELEAQA